VISLEQVRQLDIRVKKAVTAVKTLSTENTALKQQIADLEAQVDELRLEASTRQADEQQLEVSLQGVLDVLDEVDDETAEIGPDDVAQAAAVGVESTIESDQSAEPSAWETDAVETAGEAEAESEPGEAAVETAELDSPTDEPAIDIPADEPDSTDSEGPEEPEAATDDESVVAPEGGEDSEIDVPIERPFGPQEPVPEADSGASEAETPAEEDESIDLDAEQNDKDDDDRFQSEFDIF